MAVTVVMLLKETNEADASLGSGILGEEDRQNDEGAVRRGEVAFRNAASEKFPCRELGRLVESTNWDGRGT